jgi:hypothetical protein
VGCWSHDAVQVVHVGTGDIVRPLEVPGFEGVVMTMFSDLRSSILGLGLAEGRPLVIDAVAMIIFQRLKLYLGKGCLQAVRLP